MENNSVHIKELLRKLSRIQADRDTESELSEEQKHEMWLEGRQVDELLNRLLGGRHA